MIFYNGDSKEAPIQGKYLEQSAPKSITSTNNIMLIHFSSNGAIRSSGFELEYHAHSKLNSGSRDYLDMKPLNIFVNLTLNKPYVNEVTLTGQKLPLEYC